jgi:hypothetical protein
LTLEMSTFGVVNQREALSRAELLFSLCRRHAVPFSVLVVTLDRNHRPLAESQPHVDGSRPPTPELALEAAILEEIRTTDLIGRCRDQGSYVVFCPYTPREGAKELVLRLLGERGIGLRLDQLLVAVHDGERESKLSWTETLRDLKRRGLKDPPKLAVGDGALGFWAALAEVFPETREQRCWVHKTANVLDKMPKKVQPSAKQLLHEMYLAETKTDALSAFDEFVHRYGAKFPKAVKCLAKDKAVLFAFYDFPAEHWQHIRSTNPIESTFATVRHRQRQTKGCGSRAATLAMVFKLAREAEKRWRRIDGYQLIVKLLKGVTFQDGIEAQAA